MFAQQIRRSLEVSRTTGVPFELAWKVATREVPEDWTCVMSFVMDHMRSAYNRDESRAGRCRIPERDVSSAVGSVVREATVSAAPASCRSGDGCPRSAGHGRFGKFCEPHAAELDRLRLEVGTVGWRGQTIAGSAGARAA